MRILVFLSALLLISAYSSAAQADVLYLKNGDRVTGTIILERGARGHLAFSGRYGVIQVPWNDVARITDDSGVERRISGFEPDAYMTPVERSRMILSQQQSDTPAVQVAAAPVAAPVLEEASADEDVAEEDETGLWGAKWSGSVAFGASLQSGNSDKNNINGDAEIKAKWDKHRATLKSEFDRSKDEGLLTEDNRAIEGIYDYFFNDEWFFNSSLGFKQDEIADLDLRTTLGVGIGHQPYESEDLNLQYILGPTYLHEKFEDGSSEDSIAAEWQLAYDQKFWRKQLSVFHDHDLLVPTDETDDFLFESETGVKVPLKVGIVAKAAVEFDWDNKPEPGVKEDDTTYSLQVGYEW